MFEVLFAESGLRAIGETFASAAEALAKAGAIRAETGRVTRIARIVTEAWREREAARLADATYKPLPESWTLAPWWQGSVAAADHYAHVSSDGRSIAYTQSPEKGEADTQSVLKPTSYLAKYFGNVLRPEQISAIGQAFGVDDIRLHFASEPEEFARIYAGQDVKSESSSHLSCMRYESSYFGLPFHPAYAYGAGDLAIAWTQDDSATDFTVTARAVVWLERKEFVTVYGRDEGSRAKLLALLASAGFRRGELAGAKLLRIEARGGVLLPFLDGCQRVQDCGDFLLTAHDGDISGYVTEGFARLEPECSCDRCGDEIDDDESYSAMGETLCESCYSDNYFHCENCEEDSRNEDSVTVTMRRGREASWCDNCADNRGFRCEATGNHYDSTHYLGIEVRTHARRSYTETWCAGEAENYFVCERDGEAYSYDAFGTVEVTTQNGTETWCREESESEFFECSECGEAFANGMRHTRFPDTCHDCGEGLAHDALEASDSAAERASVAAWHWCRMVAV